MARATSFLARPRTAPEIMTRLLVGATFSISWRRWFIAGDVADQLGRLARSARAAP